MPHPKVKISDDSGNAVGVTSNALDVNIAGGTASIDIGDVSLLLDGTAADYGTGNVNTSGRTLRVTLASDDPAVALLTSMDADTSLISSNTSITKTNTSSLVSIIGTFGTTTYTEGATSGYVFGGVRNDTLAALADTDNEIAPLQVNGSGALYVTGESKQSEAVTAYGFGIMGEYKRIDGSTLPNTVTEGEAVRIATSSSGIQYTHLTNQAGLKSAIIDDDDEQVATPAIVNVGGEYRSGATTYADGDATILQTNINGHLKVVGTVDLGSTDNGVLDAIAASLEILDDWDDSNYANVNINLAGSDAPTGGGTESGALRVTLANDSTGVISIDDGGNTITVDGTVTANLSGTDNAVLDAMVVDLAAMEALLITIDSDTDAIKTAVEIIDNAIDGSEMQVDIVAALPAGTNAIGKLAANSGVDIGDVDIASLPAHMGSPNGSTSVFHTSGDSFTQALDCMTSIGTLMSDVLAAPANTADGEWSPLQVDTQGALYTTHGITGMLHDKNLAVGTSAEVLKTSTACKRVDMMASWDNTGYIHVGSSSVTTSLGIRLAPGDFYSIDVNNVADIYVVATVADEDIHFIYYT